MASQRLKHSDRLLSVLDEYDETMVIVHDNPDPDAIARSTTAEREACRYVILEVNS